MKFEYLKRECELNGIFLTDEQADKMVKFLEVIIEYNKFVNLTSILKFEDMVYKHIIDSLLLLKVIYIRKNCNFLDIGTGAGFPSTPIAIVEEKFKNIIQMDSLKKRVNFLDIVKNLLKLNVTPCHYRAEEAAKKEIFREKFEIVTARAISKLNILCEYSLPFVKSGGIFVAFKGPKYYEELEKSRKVIRLLGARLERVEKFKLNNNITRNLIILKKISHTPTEFPRSFAKISKNPM